VESACKVSFHLAGLRVESFRCVQLSRTDLVRQRLQQVFEAFTFEGDPYQSRPGRCQQQRSDRGVDRAVGDIDQPLLVGACSEPLLEVDQFPVVHREQGGRVRLLCSSGDVLLHGCAPCYDSPSKKFCFSRFMPSAEARRTESGLPPISSAVSTWENPPR